jgi:hypothetical protein
MNSCVESVSDFISQVKKNLGVNNEDSLFDPILGRLEGLMLLIVDLASRESLKDMIVPVMRYVHEWRPNESILKRVMRLVNSILTEDREGETVDVTSGLEGQGGWFTSNWQFLTQGQFGKRLASLITLLMITGLVPEKSTNKLTDEMFQILQVHAMRKRHPSFIDHVLSMLDWIVDGIIPAFTTGDLSLLLMDSDLKDVDEMYRNSLDMVDKSVKACHGELKKVYDIDDEADIIVYLVNTMMAHEAVKARCKGETAIQREMTSRLIKLDKLQNDLMAHWKMSGLRVQPYSILLRGPSSIGKSTISTFTCHAVCSANNLPEGKEFWCTLNGSDEYQSEFKSQHVCVIFDDMGNTLPEKAKNNPLFILIQFINNMHCCALSPEADKKGKNDIRCKVVVVTTNTFDLHASFFSCNPASIMRRFQYVVDVELKPDSVGDHGGIHEKHVGNPMPDAWKFTMNRVHLIRSMQNNLADTVKYVPKVVGGIVDYVNELHRDSVRYFDLQNKIVEASGEMHLREHCELHPRFTLPCPVCAEYHPVEEASEEDAFIKDGLERQAGLVFDPKKPEEFVKEFYDANSVEQDPVPDAQPAEDEDWVCTFPPVSRIRHICDSTVNKLCDLVKSVRPERTDAWSIGLAAFIGVATAMYGMYKMFSPPPLQGEMAIFERINAVAKKPTNFVQRDNKYQKVYTNTFTQPQASISTTLAQLESKIDRALHVVTYQEWDERHDTTVGPAQWCNAFPIGGTRWLTIGHCFEEGVTYQAEFRTAPHVGVKRFTVLINDANVERIAGEDICVLDLPGGGDVTDMSKYMLDDLSDYEVVKDTPLFVYHAHRSQTHGDEDFTPPSGYKMTSKVSGVMRQKVNGCGTFDMLQYYGDNHHGMCGSMVFTAGRNPILLAVHNAGNTSSKECGAILLDKRMLRQKGGLKASETTPLQTTILGKSFNVSPDVRESSPVHFMEHEHHNCEVYGQHDIPTAKFKSDVVESPMAPLMREKLDYEDTHTAPPAKAAPHSRRRHFEGVTKQKAPVNPAYLKVATEDFIEKLDQTVLSSEKFRECVVPLSYEDAINGVPGVKGYDPLNVLTSMGFPVNKPKHWAMMQSALSDELGLKTHKFVDRVEKDGKVEYVYTIEFDPEVADVKGQVAQEIEWMYQGRRINAIFRCNLKDEAITWKKVANNKIRVFAGAPVSLVIITRMLTLPLLNMMALFPEEFESAVGVDATGKDWDYIAKIMTKFGEDRCGDGDYAEYDMGTDCMFTKDSFKIIRHILEACGFDEELLQVLDGLATECVWPVYENKGFIFKAFRSNPSGHGLTVIINGLANSLLMRYAYYAMHNVKQLGEIPLFHQRVALMTYGDDNFFNVHEEEKLFNMMTAGQQLARIDMKYTDASKQISQVPFKPFSEISFLKRTFHKHPQLSGIVGPLDKVSIYKSLAMTHKPKKGQLESVAQICGGNLAGALAELFYHSKEEYLYHKPIFQQIADETVDEQGYRVADFYQPKTMDELIERYENTTCAYPAASAKIYGLEGQAGFVEQDHRDLVNYRFDHGDLRSAVAYYQMTNYGAVEHTEWAWLWTWILQAEFAHMEEECDVVPSPWLVEERYGMGWMSLAPPTTYEDIQFRIMLAKHADPYVNMLVLTDYRMIHIHDPLHHDAIRTAALDWVYRRGRCRTMAYICRHMSLATLDDRIPIFHPNDQVTLNIFRRLYYGKVDCGLPELTEYMMEYLVTPQPMVVHHEPNAQYGVFYPQRIRLMLGFSSGIPAVMAHLMGVFNDPVMQYQYIPDAVTLKEMWYSTGEREEMVLRLTDNACDVWQRRALGNMLSSRHSGFRERVMLDGKVVSLTFWSRLLLRGKRGFLGADLLGNPVFDYELGL